MSTVGDDLDTVQLVLQDNESLWTRTELRQWYNDGYRRLCSISGALRLMRIMDVPGRFTYTVTEEWEDRHTTGTLWKCTHTSYDAQYQCTSPWESQFLAGVTPTTSLAGVTQLWEIVYSGTTDHHFRFALPKSHEHLHRLAWNDELMLPVAVRELDWSDHIWFRAPGEPTWWTPGVGRQRSFEIYEIRTDYQQGYQLIDADYGMPRDWSGSRTYAASYLDAAQRPSYAFTTSGDADALAHATTALLTGVGYRMTIAATDTNKSFCTQQWEADMQNGATITTGATVGCFDFETAFGATVTAPTAGVCRAVSSDGYQYLPQMTQVSSTWCLGSIREWKSSVNAITTIESVIPDHYMSEADTPCLIPAPLQKYLRFYTLAMAFGHEGEGKNTELAAAYDQLWQRGTLLMGRLQSLSSRDRVFMREETTEVVVRPPRVRLPVHYPVVYY